MFNNLRRQIILSLDRSAEGVECFNRYHITGCDAHDRLCIGTIDIVKLALVFFAQVVFGTGLPLGDRVAAHD